MAVLPSAGVLASVLISMVVVVLPMANLPGDVCRGDMDIRNRPANISILRRCRVIEGFLQIVLMERATPADFADLSFPNLTEVTSYVLLWQVAGLVSVGRLFPNLSLIRGSELLLEKYSLVVYEMPTLVELKLPKLRSIAKGSVRITKNPELCFADSLDWNSIAVNGRKDNVIRGNKNASLCRACTCPEGACWADRVCQNTSQPMVSSQGDPCHKRCSVGCAGTSHRDCFACAGFEVISSCRDECPNNSVSIFGRRCITRRECATIGSRFVHKGSCVRNCPPGYEMVHLPNGTFCRPCMGPCTTHTPNCQGAAIRSLREALNMKGCTFVNGSLEIEISSGLEADEDLEPALGHIQEIGGSLIVRRSRSLTSLHFLRSLRAVNGKDERWPYPIYIHLNDNLQRLFDWTGNRKIDTPHSVAIIHYNRRLCSIEIQKLINNTVLRVYNVHNGFISSCEENGENGCPQVSARVKLRGSEFVILVWDAPLLNKSNCKDKTILGYAVYHIKVQNRNITNYSGDDWCANSDQDDDWIPHDVQMHGNTEIHKMLTKLKPATRYAFYVKMYTENKYVHSPIYYFRTLPDKPTPPVEVQAVSRAKGDLSVQWEPPLHLNGPLSHYIVVGELIKDSTRQLDNRDFCIDPIRKQNSPHVIRSRSTEGGCDVSDDLTEEQCINLMQTIEPYNVSVQLMDRCDHVFYTIISENLGAVPHEFPSSPINAVHYSAPSLNLTEEWIYSENDEWPRRFVRVTNASDTQVTINGLRHFGLYLVKVRACGKPDNDRGSPPFGELCSAPSTAWSRTMAFPAADKIKKFTVKTLPWAIQVNWTKPDAPNGLLVAYQIQYRNTKSDTEITVCVTRQEHQANRGKRIGVDPGAYIVLLRAVSLGGTGPWTEATNVLVLDHEESHITAIVIILILVVICLGLGGFWIWRRRRLLASDTDSDSRHLIVDPADFWDFPWDSPSLASTSHPDGDGVITITKQKVVFEAHANLQTPQKTTQEISNFSAPLHSSGERDKTEATNSFCYENPMYNENRFQNVTLSTNPFKNAGFESNDQVCEKRADFVPHAKPGLQN